MAKMLCAAVIVSMMAAGGVFPAVATEVIGQSARDNEAVSLWLKSAWREYAKRFVTADGAVIDDGNQGISHSESQGYGMVLAVAVDDRELFERIRDYTFETLQVRKDHLFAWKVEHTDKGPNVADTNNATDGDLLIAWGLVEAYKSWGENENLSSARLVLKDIAEKLVRDTGFGPVLLPGEIGFSSGKGQEFTLNPSYWVYPALEAVARFDTSANWEEIAVVGEEVLDLSQRAPSYLPPDWVDVSGIKLDPAEKFPLEFGYNAIRIPLYLALSTNAYREKKVADFAALKGFDAPGGPYVVHVVSGETQSVMGGKGFAAVAALTRCMDTSEPFPPELLRVGADPYYSSTLQIFTVLALAERYPQCLSQEG
ncbi:glycosyl hydrolase family 8 [Labrenzia sp. OB1]|uniref:glycosyl hydrolase family 8 n=1 Tax=Labrenzia sp. OB1 TaxID=1561204 RepID=UPI000837C24B|nr:glycosyl hydrolase family 8 [Labrenzia sp. OB1]